jgi:hypothetical protein
MAGECCSRWQVEDRRIPQERLGWGRPSRAPAKGSGKGSHPIRRWYVRRASCILAGGVSPGGFLGFRSVAIESLIPGLAWPKATSGRGAPEGVEVMPLGGTCRGGKRKRWSKLSLLVRQELTRPRVS